MVGYACSETPQMLPLPVVLAHRLAGCLTTARKSGMVRGLRPDGKAQVTVEYDEDGRPLRLDTVVLSAQHSPEKPADELFWELTDKVLAPALQALPPDEDTKILLNPSGRFVLGGPEADTGLTGRKLMVDSYGVFAPHGGGAFSGKDPTKVDRSRGIYGPLHRQNLVAAGLCSRCQVTLAYAIGKAEPVMVEVDTFGTGAICARRLPVRCGAPCLRADPFGDHRPAGPVDAPLYPNRSLRAFWKARTPLGAYRPGQDPPGNGNLTQRKEHSHARSEQRADRRRQADDCHRVFAPVSPP